jgi:hypothetical protein
MVRVIMGIAAVKCRINDFKAKYYDEKTFSLCDGLFGDDCVCGE